jgi:thioredoxin 1
MSKVVKFKWALLPLIYLLQACTVHSHEPNMAIGEISASQLLADYPEFAHPEQAYSVTAQQQREIAQWPPNLTIHSYFGTWCHDSQREMPRLLKILTFNAQIRHKLIALDGTKSEPSGAAKAANIHFTPTIVLSIAGQELGRIVERPKTNLVDEISAILAGRHLNNAL